MSETGICCDRSDCSLVARWIDIRSAKFVNARRVRSPEKEKPSPLTSKVLGSGDVPVDRLRAGPIDSRTSIRSPAARAGLTAPCRFGSRRRISSGHGRARLGAPKQNPQHIFAMCWAFSSGDVLLSHGLSPDYHRGCSVSLPCSEWERVVPLRYCHQSAEPHCPFRCCRSDASAKPNL